MPLGNINYSPVCITEEVREHVDVDIDAGWTKRGDNGQNVIRSPASHKRTEDEGDSFQSFSRSIFCFHFLSLLFPEPDFLSNFIQKILFHGGRRRTIFGVENQAFSQNMSIIILLKFLIIDICRVCIII